MKSSRFSRISRRRLVAASAIGGMAAVATGQYLGATPGTREPVTLLTQNDSADVPMFRGNPARTGQMPGPGPDDSNGVEAIWQFATKDSIYSSPTVVDGAVYVGSYDTNLYALNAEDGTERWQFATGDYINSSPAVVDGVVCVGSLDTNLYALNAEDGTERWRFTTGSWIRSSPVMVNGVVYFGSDDGNLYALNAEDGTERWRFGIDDTVTSSPAVVDNVVYVNVVYVSSPAVVDGVVYVGSLDTNLYALNAEDGTERWRFTTGDAIGSSPVMVNGVVYVGSTDGNLYAIGARVPRLSVGGTARVTETTSLRGGPSSTAVERAVLEPDTVVTITDESETTSDVVWWPVVVNDSDTPGWVEASKLEPLTSGPNPIGTP